MNRQQAQYLAKFDPDYVARPMRGKWVVWSKQSDHVVEFDKLPPVDLYGEVLINRRQD